MIHNGFMRLGDGAARVTHEIAAGLLRHVRCRMSRPSYRRADHVEPVAARRGSPPSAVLSRWLVATSKAARELGNDQPATPRAHRFAAPGCLPPGSAWQSRHAPMA